MYIFLKRCKKKDAAPDHPSFFGIFLGKKDATFIGVANAANFKMAAIEPRTSGRGPATNWQVVAVILDWLEIQNYEKWIIGTRDRWGADFKIRQSRRWGET